MPATRLSAVLLTVPLVWAGCQRPATSPGVVPPDSAPKPAATAPRAALAPEIELPAADGSRLKLSSLRGKYVLVDFWASWCRPCREESPNLRKIYGQFHSRGLEIVSVSLDDNRARWHQAIAADELTWYHVSDLRGWQNAAARAYGVRAIPYSVLLDPEGRVLATNLRGRALGQKISEYIPLD
ncbi:TlpA disulfide reductase family protein [Hymenobacter sp. UYP22]|uniref:peroxiredoxin family protein n=1 Tax=Hymenobacter sp. UYP22 TaxID=3156348 RepID=UPI003393A667